MSFPARFSDNLEVERGYEEIAKAVFQIWRFAAHCRLGIASSTIAEDCVGIVLTLDSWMLMGSAGVAERIFDRAREMCASKEPRCLPEDQVAVIFCQIPEWEDLLTSSTEDGIRRLIKANASEEFRGWLLSSIPKHDEEKRRYRFPFRDFHRIIPWWRRGHLRSQKRDAQET